MFDPYISTCDVNEIFRLHGTCIILHLQLEVEIEASIDGNLTLCGVYLRYGNNIYAYSICGGVFIEGLIFGDGNYMKFFRETMFDYVSKVFSRQMI